MGTTASAPSGTTPPVEIAIASPAPSARVGRAAGGDALDDGERPGSVAGANREAVHRGARERRQVDAARAASARDAARRVRDRHRLGAERLRAGEHERLRLLDGE